VKHPDTAHPRFLVAFDVIGDPTPQGSKTKMPNGAMLEGGTADLRAKRINWRNAVADAARERVELVGKLDGDLELRVTFRFAVPKSRTKAVEANGGIGWKNTAPDLDKLVRSCGDSLTASGLIRDDARLVHIRASKVETVAWTGASIELWRAGHG